MIKGITKKNIIETREVIIELKIKFKKVFIFFFLFHIIMLSESPLQTSVKNLQHIQSSIETSM